MPVRIDCRMCGYSGVERSNRRSCPKCGCRLVGSSLIITPVRKE